MDGVDTTSSSGSLNSGKDEPVSAGSLSKLNTSWVLWFDTPGKVEGKRKQAAAVFSSGLRRVGTFDSIEEFWGIMNSLVVLGRVPLGSNLYLFRAGIEPRWEV